MVETNCDCIRPQLIFVDFSVGDTRFQIEHINGSYCLMGNYLPVSSYRSLAKMLKLEKKHTYSDHI